MVTTGLRVGEATALRWEDIDLDAGAAMVRQTLHRQRGQGMVIGPPKTDRSRRRVYLATNVVVALRQRQWAQKEEALASGRSWAATELAFTTVEGTPFDPGYLLQELHCLLKRADLPTIRVHDLRHTAATYLLSTGTHPKVVQEMLGHSSITLTMDTYSHVLPAMHRQAASEMDALFRAGDAG